jgi:hypothetical protein
MEPLGLLLELLKTAFCVYEYRVLGLLPKIKPLLEYLRRLLLWLISFSSVEPSFGDLEATYPNDALLEALETHVVGWCLPQGQILVLGMYNTAKSLCGMKRND